MSRLVLAALIAAIALAPTAHGQGFGISNLLNPEGSRLFPQSVVYPRHAGKPDPRWKNFNWKFVDRNAEGAKYRMYFYDTEQWAASFTLPRIDEQVAKLKKVFRYTPDHPFDYALFTSLKEFQQANLFFISEGVRGITSTEEATMAVPYTGHRQEFDHVSLHEMVHQFQVQKIRSLAKLYAPETFALFPLWFIEGMAEYYSQGNGMDRESRMYLRDLVLHSNPEKGFEVPDLFDSGPLNFLMVYKVGQAKIDFFETEFGTGTAQMILESLARSNGAALFQTHLEKTLGLKADKIEKRWRAYLARYKEDPLPETVSLDAYEEIKEAGDTLDTFAISPDEQFLAVRDVDPLTGVTAIKLIDLDNGRDTITVAKNDKSDTLSLFFFEFPSVALSNDAIAFVAESTSGPEIEIRQIRRNDKKIVIDDYRRIPLHKNGLIQASYLTINEDGRIAFVGLTPDGWENVYVLEPSPHEKGEYEMRRLTDSYYAWKGLAWRKAGGRETLVGSVDRTSSGAYNLFEMDPRTGDLSGFARSDSDQTSPAPALGGDDLVFRSWQSGTSQIHRLRGGVETRLTAVETMLDQPLLRGKYLYAVGFRSGRYSLFRIPRDKLLSESVHEVVAAPSKGPWVANPLNLNTLQVSDYKPFSSSGVRISNLGAFLSSGGVAGIAGVASDLMRNYQIAGEFFFLGEFALSTAAVFLSSQKGRDTWTLGGYHVAQRRLDNIFMNLNDGDVRTHVHREYGVLGSVQHPLGPYSYVDVGLRLAGVQRRDFSDENLEVEWEAFNPGAEFMLAPVVRLGFDKIIYEMVTGPLRGYSMLLESDTSVFPARGAVDERIRFDTSYYFQLVNRMVLAFQGLAGLTIDGNFRNPFFLSSDDFLRIYPYGDDRLYGNYVLAARGELRFPIGELFGFPYLRGLVSYDLGSVFNRSQEIPTKFTSSYTSGLQFNIPPIAMALMLSWPGAVAPGPQLGYPTVHFTLRYLYL